MKKVEITSLWVADIFQFVDHHISFLADRFYDTGIESELLIRERYMLEWYELGMEIYNHIVDVLAQDILPYQEIAFDIRLSVLTIWQRRVFVRYFEKTDVREVFDIKIYHR